MYKHSLARLENHNILTDLQHGFRPRRSCETQLVTNFLSVHSSNAQQKGKSIDISVLDLSKAFDMLPHNAILSKLNHYVMVDHIWQWISNILKHRKQIVVIFRFL